MEQKSHSLSKEQGMEERGQNPQDSKPDAGSGQGPPIPFIRLGVTGIFMGLANLVPGVSGGTMVLALGLYEEFIESFSSLTRLRFSRRSILIVGLLFGVSALTILLLSGLMQYLMESFLPGMLGLFIGMTLGGAPLLFKELQPVRPAGVVFTWVGIALMAMVAFVLKPDLTEPGWFYLFLGGMVGSAAMILPGISGSYMLLIMGLYLPIIAGVSEFKEALQGRDLALLITVGTKIILPVGLGLVAGLVLLSNLLKYLLRAWHKPTIGFLLGLLLGSVLGLYPFQEPGFDKLPRYAVMTEEGKNELRICGFGWLPGDQSAVDRMLQELKTENLDVVVISSIVGPFNSPASLETAREKQAVCIAYDVPVSREIRRAAADEEAGEVEIIIVPDTEYNAGRAGLVILLVLVGFLITFSMSWFGEKKPKKKT